MEGKILKRIKETYCTNVIKLADFFEINGSMFHVQDHTKDFVHIIEYASKQLEIYLQLFKMVFNIF